MEYQALFLLICLVFGFLLNDVSSWWDSRRRRRRCTARNCILSAWSSWGNCSLPCGGEMIRTRNITRVQSCGGRCFRFIERKPCNGNCCPVDCVWSWGAWGICQGNCGTGRQSRTIVVTTQSSCNGAACPSNRSQTRACRGR